jgi:sugar phosphate isomerase/epimerase
MTRNNAAQVKRGVTLYSYQEEFYTRTMTLEDCLAEVQSMDVEGVELLPEQMIPEFPNPSKNWLDDWHRMLSRFNLTPVCMDTFVDTTWGGHREMSLQESVSVLEGQLKLAKELGFPVIRPTTGPVEQGALSMIRAAIPLAEKHNVKIAVEIHAPIRLRSKYINEYLDVIAETGTKHFGFTLDFGIFCKHPPKIVVDYVLRKGATTAIVEYILRAFNSCVDQQEVAAEVQRLGGNQADAFFSRYAFAFGPPDNDPQDLLRIGPYIYNVHGKFYEMTEECCETSISYEQVIPALIASGYSGYINSEYEGQRNTQDIVETDSCEQIRRHQVMLKRLLGELVD